MINGIYYSSTSTCMMHQPNNSGGASRRGAKLTVITVIAEGGRGREAFTCEMNYPSITF